MVALRVSTVKHTEIYKLHVSYYQNVITFLIFTEKTSIF